MTTTDIWDDPEIRTASNFVTFENVGDTVAGTIVKLWKNDYEGKISPAIDIDERGDGSEAKTLVAKQTKLKGAMSAIRPQVQDRIAVTYTGDGDRQSGRNPAKLFRIELRRASASDVVEVWTTPRANDGAYAVREQATVAPVEQAPATTTAAVPPPSQAASVV